MSELSNYLRHQNSDYLSGYCDGPISASRLDEAATKLDELEQEVAKLREAVKPKHTCSSCGHTDEEEAYINGWNDCCAALIGSE